MIGTDPKTDLALLKVKDGGDFPFVKFAAQAPRVGDWVIAVGNPFGLGGTVTAGIVSARGRDIGSGPYDDFLQIDAPVNHGNSGGPTFNAEGEVVGVNTAIFSPSGGSVGIGFAIASDVVEAVIEQLKDDGAVDARLARRRDSAGDARTRRQPRPQGCHGRAGRQAQNDNSPAAAAGVKVGDVITAVNGEAVADPRDLARKHRRARPEEDRRARRSSRNGARDHRRDARRDAGRQAGEGRRRPTADDGARRSAREARPDARAGAAAGRRRVADVDPDGAAAEKGLQAGDVILEVAGKPVPAVRGHRRLSTRPRPTARSRCCCA